MNIPQTPLAIKLFLAEQGYAIKETINFHDETKCWLYNFSIEKTDETGKIDFLAIKPLRFKKEDVERQDRPFSVHFQHSHAAHMEVLFKTWVKKHNFKFNG